MRENNENTFQETQTAFAIAIALLNFLILTSVIGFVWSLQLLLTPDSPLGAVLSEMIRR